MYGRGRQHAGRARGFSDIPTLTDGLMRRAPWLNRRSVCVFGGVKIKPGAGCLVAVPAPLPPCPEGSGQWHAVRPAVVAACAAPHCLV